MKEEIVFEFIWTKIYAKLMDEIAKTSQSSIAKRLSVGNAQISRWVSGAQKGGNLNTVIKTAVRLGMSLKDFTENSSGSLFDQEVGRTLGRVADSLNVTVAEIEKNTEGDISSARLLEVFKGNSFLSVEELRNVCSALGCSVDKVLESAGKSVQKTNCKKMVA
jgi:transposase-like protein